MPCNFATKKMQPSLCYVCANTDDDVSPHFRTPFHPFRLMDFLESIFFVILDEYEEEETIELKEFERDDNLYG